MVRDVLRLVTGTVAGRAIFLLAMPIATKLYTPEDFGLLAVYLAPVGILSAVACLRFDYAIPVAESDEDAAHLFVLSILSLVAVTSGLAIAGVIAPHFIVTALGQQELEPWILLIPVAVLFGGTYSATQFWATRFRRFAAIARTRATQAVAGVVVILGFGVANLRPLGLLAGNMLNLGAGGGRLGIDAIRLDRRLLRCVTLAGLKTAAVRYRSYPTFSSPEAVANMAGAQLPVVILAASNKAEAGFLLLALQVMSAPLSLLGASIAQVYVSRATEALHQNRLAEYTLGVVRQLARLGALPLFVVGLSAPIFVPPVFGANWRGAGVTIALIVPWMLLQLVSSPISLVMYVARRQKAMLWLALFGAALRIGSVTAAIALGQWPLEVFAASSAVFYAILLIVFLHVSGFRFVSSLALFRMFGCFVLLAMYFIFVVAVW